MAQGTTFVNKNHRTQTFHIKSIDISLFALIALKIISDNCMNGSEETSPSKTMMQASGDLKQYIGYTNSQSLKHISESSLTLTQPLQIPVSKNTNP